jgi:hypothetical protein
LNSRGESALQGSGRTAQTAELLDTVLLHDLDEVLSDSGEVRVEGAKVLGLIVKTCIAVTVLIGALPQGRTVLLETADWRKSDGV